MSPNAMAINAYTYTLPSLLLVFPFAYVIYSKLYKITFSNWETAVSLGIAWQLSAIPVFFYGESFFSDNAGMGFFVPILASSFSFFIIWARRKTVLTEEE